MGVRVVMDDKFTVNMRPAQRLLFIVGGDCIVGVDVVGRANLFSAKPDYLATLGCKAFSRLTAMEAFQVKRALAIAEKWVGEKGYGPIDSTSVYFGD